MPEIAVIVVNWNGAHLLKTCLTSLREQTWRDFETILVDNGSSDESLALVARDFPDVRVIALDENLGLAGGTNVGIEATDAPIIATLNNDTEVDAHWLEELEACARRPPEAGSVASKLLLFDRRDVIHSAGDFYRVDGVPGNRGVWQPDDGRYTQSELIFGACAGAAAYRRTMLEDVGGFDDTFFMYCEDVDLAFRGQLLGYRCVFAPNAIVYHMLSATGGGPLASYYCGRNFLRVIARDMPGRSGASGRVWCWHSCASPGNRSAMRASLPRGHGFAASLTACGSCHACSASAARSSAVAGPDPLPALDPGGSVIAGVARRPSRAFSKPDSVPPDPLSRKQERGRGDQEERETVDISIVVVSYNRHDLVSRCIDSILSDQDRPDLELIVVDNASGDGTAATIAERYPDGRTDRE